MKRVSPTLIGAFVLGGVALAVASVLVLGGREWFKRPLTCVMGFDGSVAGLTVEAPVSFRGVQVGKVARIELRPGTPVIVVVADIDPSQVRGMPARLHREHPTALLTPSSQRPRTPHRPRPGCRG